MNVQAVYTKYAIPPNLQKHMLRVAALAEIVTENWKGDRIDGKSIVLACLFHDMANIIKFDFSKPSLFKEEESQKEYWREIQLEYIEKYGHNIHEATFKIGKEIGLSPVALNIIKKLEWDNTSEVVRSNDFETAIAIYCDMRIGPVGILSLQERIDNLATRNKTHDFVVIREMARDLKGLLRKNININPDIVKDIDLIERFDSLSALEVK